MKLGSLVIAGGDHTRTWSAGAGEPRILVGPGGTLAQVSPYEDVIAWVEHDGVHWLRAGGETGVITVNLELPSLRQWLADDQVLIQNLETIRGEEPGVVVDELYVLSLTTGQLVSTTVSLPRPTARATFMDHWRTRPLYDPRLRAAIYAWQDESGTGLLLMDLSEADERWISRDWPWIIEYSDSQWRLDGTMAVIAGPPLDPAQGDKTELMLVDIEGNATQLTYLQALPEFDRHENYYLRVPHWSPDGRYIATILVTDPLGITPLLSGTLLIVDTVAQTVTDYCLTSVSYENPPVWSPAGDQLAFYDPETKYVNILDLASKQVGTITGAGGGLMGWLAADLR